MKVKRIPWLIVVSIVFAAFVFGFFAGRNGNRTPVYVYAMGQLPQTQTVTPLPTVTPPDAEDDPSGITPAAVSRAEAPAESTGLININTATRAQLETLPGIGSTIAQRIIDYRDAHGPFSSVGALIHVSGIGEKKLEAIWNYVTVEGA